MEPEATTIEETAGQIAVAVTDSAATASDTAVQAVSAVADKAEAATETAAQAVSAVAAKAEAASETAVEAVNTIADDVVTTVEEEQVQMGSTVALEPSADDSASCPVSGSCDPVVAGIVVAVVVVIVAIVALLTKKKKPGKKAAPSKSGKSNGPDMVEIYVGNLSYDMTDAQLRREFERFGVVKSARVITHRTNSKSKGYGFVEMPHRKEALIGIKALDNSEVLGRRIRVNEARANTRPPER